MGTMGFGSPALIEERAFFQASEEDPCPDTVPCVTVEDVPKE